MAPFHLTLSRLVAIGGLTALSGTAYSIYDIFAPVDKVDCKPAGYYDDNGAIYPNFKKKCWDDNWDLRGTDTNAEKDTEKEKSKPTATRHVILIRHGQYVQAESSDPRLRSRLRKLTELGRQQATITGERLKSLGLKFDHMTISTVTRAQETGSIISNYFPDLEKTDCSLLREGAPYPVEPESKNWQPDEVTLYQDNPRIEAAFRKYIHRADPKQKEDSYELLVCHGNVIRYFICRSLQFPPEGWLRMYVANCGLTWLTIRPNGRVSLRALGDAGHLPPDFITYN